METKSPGEKNEGQKGSPLQRTRLEFEAGSNQIRSNRVSDAFPVGSTLTFPAVCKIGSLTTTGSAGNSPTTLQTYSLRTIFGWEGSLLVPSCTSGGWNRSRIIGSATLAKMTTPEVTASSLLIAKGQKRKIQSYIVVRVPWYGRIHSSRCPLYLPCM